MSSWTILTQNISQLALHTCQYIYIYIYIGRPTDGWWKVANIYTGLLEYGCTTGIFLSDASLQYRSKKPATSKIYRCNVKKYMKKLIKSFDSRTSDRKFSPQHNKHYVSCNIDCEICKNNNCNIKDQLLKHISQRPIFFSHPDVALAFPIHICDASS